MPPMTVQGQGVLLTVTVRPAPPKERSAPLMLTTEPPTSIRLD